MPINRNYDYWPACICRKEGKYCLEVFGIIFAQEGETVIDHEWFKNRPGYFLEEHKWSIYSLDDAKEEINQKFREEVTNALNTSVDKLFNY